MLKFGIHDILEEKKNLLSSLETSGYIAEVENVEKELLRSLASDGKILLAGNGGSAADAQHFAGELVGRFLKERKALPAISLCVDPTTVTCISNDYGYENVFARQIEALGNEGDVFIGISTSGNSKNIIAAAKVAHERKIKVICLLGNDGGALRNLCDYALIVPSDSTPRIQEIHTFTIHILCEKIESDLFGN